MIEGFAIVEGGRVLEDRGSGGVVPWWSFGKTLIAAAALALVRDGKLELDRLLAGRPFSMRQLLQHRAGVTNYGGLADYHHAVDNDEEPWSPEHLLRRLDADQLIFPPGEGWAYSNVGYLFVRQAIEACCQADLDVALRRLVFEPLGVEARVALTRHDLAGVSMGEVAAYHPGWVYHGLVVGRISDAARALDRLMCGDLLPPHLMAAMREVFAFGGPLADRPWQTTGYGLGLMMGTSRNGRRFEGHTGGGPGSVIAVYHHVDSRPHRTIAAFAIGERESEVEQAAFGGGRAP